jgi:hypothetical protein
LRREKNNFLYSHYIAPRGEELVTMLDGRSRTGGKFVLDPRPVFCERNSSALVAERLFDPKDR